MSLSDSSGAFGSVLPLPEPLDLLVVGAGPTGIAIGAEALQAGLKVLLIDRLGLCSSIERYPTYLEFFTTRERLEIAGVPFAIPEVKPSRRQALTYYRAVVQRFAVPLALYEVVLEVRRPKQPGGDFEIRSVRHAEPSTLRLRRARAVALATGYFEGVKRLGVPGEDMPWVHHRYREAFAHFGQHVVIVGAGNTAAETALDLWRSGVRVTLVHRGAQLKPGVKYWLKPDLENRIAEGSIAARFRTVVKGFRDGRVLLETPEGSEELEADAVYVLIGYVPDADFERHCGVEVDAESLVPRFDPQSCESNVAGLYIAGTIQAGRSIDKIFIENSREHAPKIVGHLRRRLEAERVPE